jgi:TolA-binding protein
MGDAVSTVKSDTQAIIESLHSHSIKVNYLLVLVLAVVIGTFGAFYLHSVHSYENLLGRAEQREATYLSKLDQLDKRLEDSQNKIDQLQAQQSKVQTQIVYRDKETDKQIGIVTAPDRAAIDIASDVQTNYNFSPVTVAPDLLTFKPYQVQTFVATKLDRERLFQDVKGLNTMLSLEKETTATLTEDKQECKAALTEAKGVIDGYKHVAKKTKWQRIKDAGEKTGLIVFGLAIGRYLR